MRTIVAILIFFISILQGFAQKEVDVYTAAKAGHVEAQKDLGLLKIQEGNYSEAMSWLKKAAEKGNADAQFNLAIMYRDGEGCSVDYSQAMFWFKKAAENSHPRAEAYGEIGKMYQFGYGVPRNISEATSWYKKGANYGDHYSMSYLGRIYRDSGDLNQALIWFRRSADAGNEECACYVYYLLEDEDIKTALRYLKKSAEAGYPNGMFWYGLRQMLGKDIKKNEKEGYDMIMKAAVKGSEAAMKFLTEYKQ